MKLALQSIVGVLDAQTNFCDNLFNHPPSGAYQMEPPSPLIS